jgi:hypothetical protein
MVEGGSSAMVVELVVVDGTFLLVFLVKDHPKDAELLNKPIMNYDEKQTIFAGGLSTGKFAMGSNEPLGTPTPSLEEEANTHKSDTIIIDGPDKPADAHRDKGK